VCQENAWQLPPLKKLAPLFYHGGPAGKVYLWLSHVVLTVAQHLLLHLTLHVFQLPRFLTNRVGRCQRMKIVAFFTWL